jgi:hypothetical protein
VAVIGSRRRDGPHDLDQVLTYLAQKHDAAETVGRKIVIVSGGASAGADRHAERVAEAIGLDLVRFRPRPIPSGSPYYAFARALLDRNGRIVELADVVAAQIHPDRKGGTEDALKKAHAMGKAVVLLAADGKIVAELSSSKDRKRSGTKGEKDDVQA